jgi:hypothetical protein
MTLIIKKISTLVCILLVLISCSKDTEPDLPIVLSSENIITSFKLTINGEIINGTIDQIAKTISFTLVGAELSSLKPTIQYSEKARIFPSENENQNFNNEVTYTVDAENGDTNIYRVIVNNRQLFTENKILSFSVSADNETFVGNINQDTNIINFDIGGLNKSSLVPVLSFSENATISPDPTIPQNFEVPVIYTVTAENGDKREYKIIANMPDIENYSNSYNPFLYYIRANIMISGKFLDPDKTGAEIYLFDGVNKYELPIIKHENYSREIVTIFNLYTRIPENVPTNKNYKIIYKTNLLEIESAQFIDVVAENAPKFKSLSQNSYSWNDVLVINGENLTDVIVIPSNGSNFIVSNSNKYDYTLNNDKTQISLILDYYYLFPAYFGRPPSEKTITFWGPERRIGESFTTTFN